MLTVSEIGNVFKRAQTNSRFKFRSLPKNPQRRTPYAILGVSEQATSSQIKKAYIEKARELHPDSNPAAKDAEFIELHAAYETLQERHRNHNTQKKTTHTQRTATSSHSTKSYNRYKDYTDDPKFKTHSKHNDNMKQENTTEFDHSDSDDKNMTIHLLGVLLGSYLATLTFCLRSYQLDDGTRNSLVGQLIGHFSGDQRYSWRQIFRNKIVKDKMAEYHKNKEMRKIQAVDRSKTDPYSNVSKGFVDKTALEFRKEKKKHDQYMGRFKDQIYRDLGEDVYNTSVGTYDSSNPSTGQKPGLKEAFFESRANGRQKKVLRGPAPSIADVDAHDIEKSRSK